MSAVRRAASRRAWMFGRGLASLLDMLLFNGKALVRLVGILSQLSMVDILPNNDEPVSDSLKASILDTLTKHGAALNPPGFALSKMEAEELRRLIESDRPLNRFVAFTARSLRHRIEDELSLATVWQIPPNLMDFFQAELFGSEVAVSFPSAAFDIEEAGKCFGVGRTTACVYHLMRVTEAGLKVIAQRIGYPDARPMWEPVLSYLDKQLGTKYEELSDRFKGDIEFLSGVAAQMHAVNLAWRRRVMHVERQYSEGEARRIFDATKGLMQHLAVKLAEPEGTTSGGASSCGA